MSQQVFRFKNDPTIIALIERFSTIHADDALEDFNDAWDDFMRHSDEIIQRERVRLEAIGYSGNLQQKLYVSARYYYRNKNKVGDAKDSGDAKDGGGAKDSGDAYEKKRSYKKVQSNVLVTIDEFLTREASGVKPSVAWEQFCSENGDTFCEKKTFKNRAYRHKTIGDRS